MVITTTNRPTNVTVTFSRSVTNVIGYLCVFFHRYFKYTNMDFNEMFLTHRYTKVWYQVHSTGSHCFTAFGFAYA